MFVFLIIVFLISFALTSGIRRLAINNNVFDIPNHRSLHQHPVPRGGGIVFVLLFYVVLLLLWHLHRVTTATTLMWLGGVPVTVVGACDDVLSISNKVRLITQVVAVAWSVYWLALPPMFFCLALLSIVWLINLYNFMDGIDGLAAAQAIFVSMTAGVLLWFGGFFSNAILCLALAFSVLGFLIWNWQPAKIFMGDSGSGFLGYIFGVMLWETHVTHQLSWLIWVVLLGVFWVDATLTLLRRFFQGKSWYLSHCEHAYQQLAQRGFSHRCITSWIVLLNMLTCLPVVWWVIRHPGSFLISMLLATLVLFGFCILWFLTSRQYWVI